MLTPAARAHKMRMIYTGIRIITQTPKALSKAAMTNGNRV